MVCAGPYEAVQGLQQCAGSMACLRRRACLIPMFALGLDTLLTWLILQMSSKGSIDKKLLEHFFVFACVWAFGGTMLVDKVTDFRTQFSRWWVTEWKNIRFPDQVHHPIHPVLQWQPLGS